MPAKTILADVCEHKKAGEFFFVDPDVIEIDPTWNARKDFSGENELVELIKTSGVPGILTVKKTDEKRLVLVSGERRLRAARRARKEGADIKAVPVMVAKRGTNDAELFFNDICSNSGKPLTATEEANAFKRLKNWGFDIADIAKRSGRSLSHVRNRLELANASPAIQKAVEAGHIALRDHGFDPESIRISIKPFPPTKQKKKQLETDDFESTDTCIDCGGPVNKGMYLCDECFEKAKEEDRQNRIKDRAAISE